MERSEVVRIDRKKLVCTMLDKDLNVKELAELSGISRSTITSIRNGKSCAKGTVYILAKALGMEPEELIQVDN